MKKEKKRKWQSRQGQHPYKDIMDSPLPVNKLFVRYAAEFYKYDVAITIYAGGTHCKRETAHHERGETRHKMDVIEGIVSWRKSKKVTLSWQLLVFFSSLPTFFYYIFQSYSYYKVGSLCAIYLSYRILDDEITNKKKTAAVISSCCDVVPVISSWAGSLAL
jgi:hypothetical protein